MSVTDHSALGPALGYAYQFERATYRLLEADKNVVWVGLELVDDDGVEMTARQQAVGLGTGLDEFRQREPVAQRTAQRLVGAGRAPDEKQ